MRRAGVVIVLVGILLGGCVTTTTQDVAPASVAVAPPPASGPLKAHALEIQIPAGTSFSVVWLNVTKDDYSTERGPPQVMVGALGEKGAKAEAMAVTFWRVDGAALKPFGATFGAGASGGGGVGTGGDPAHASFLAIVQVDNASAPFTARLGRLDPGNFTILGDPIAGRPIAQGTDSAIAFYLDLQFPLGPAKPFAHGVTVRDERTQPPAPARVASAGGGLTITASHAFASPGLHEAFAFARAQGGARAWSANAEIDGASHPSKGTMVSTPPISTGPFTTAVSPVASLARETLTLDAGAGVLESVVFDASSVAFDPTTLGLAVAPRFSSNALPLASLTPGCVVLAEDLGACAAPSEP